MPLTATKTDILLEAKKLFFANGTSSLACDSEYSAFSLDFVTLHTLQK